MKNTFVENLKNLHQEGKSQEEILYYMHLNDVKITEAIVMVRAVYGIKLVEAKRIVTSSVHWADAVNGGEQLHDVSEMVAKLDVNY